MERKSFFTLDMLFGILLGVAIPYVIVVVAKWESIKEWQSLIAGILALIGAAGAVVSVMYQIRHAQEMEDKRRWRSMQAARTLMPQALSILSAYAKECCKALSAITGGSAPTDAHDWSDAPDGWLAPKMPDTPMPILKECAEFGNENLQLRNDVNPKGRNAYLCLADFCS